MVPGTSVRSSRTVLRALPFLILFALPGATLAANVIYVNPNAPGPARNGASWGTAYLTVQNGLNAAASGDEVRVAGATYNERIVLKGGVTLLGGFAGSGANPNERNLTTYRTALDGQAGGTVVIVPEGTSPAPVVDGFTIRNGRRSNNGGGVWVESGAAAVLRHNTITGNKAGYDGAGVYVTGASIVLDNNRIEFNETINGSGDGGGAHIYNSSCIIRNNLIANNRAGDDGGGLYLVNVKGVATVVGNTIVKNLGNNSILLDGVTGVDFRVSSNLIAFNKGGMYRSGVHPKFHYNCVYANGRNYLNNDDPTGTDGNIVADPKLVDVPYDNFHIQADSPCVGAGDNSVVQTGDTDMDGEARQRPGGNVDIGADESQGNMIPFHRVIRVKPTGNDSKDGASWANAKQTLSEAIDAARGGEVWVAAGTYPGQLTIRDLALYGGFTGTETKRDDRNFRTHLTVLDGGAAGTVVTMDPYATVFTIVDGFTIRNGVAPQNGGGVLIKESGEPILRNNTITGNKGSSGGGIYADTGRPVIENNRILDNQATNGTGDGGGLMAYHSAPVIRGNLIAGNSFKEIGSATNGSAIYLSHVKDAGLIVNNTIVRNQGPSAVHLFDSDAVIPFANNIIAFNSGGLSRGDDQPLMRCNNLFANPTGAGYLNGAVMTGSDGNVSQDPLFVNADGLDFHLQTLSCAISAGDDAYVPNGAVDLGGRPRLFGVHADMGAFETDRTFGIVDIPRATRIAGGVLKPSSREMSMMDVETANASANRIDLADAIRINRIVRDMDP